ncbi:porin family protein [Aegicerativicinus sediminis]|uniref:porin family protein n=1 Tax=Aegicerativicinus sediminis TaxID=2893202 RepID=UPI001E3F961F|nr:porin family protein [Aegicerativicinus sediminis]
MKKLIFSALLGLMTTFAINAQSGSSFGIKAGLNYNANGNYFESIEANAQNPDRNVGYHIGVFGKLGNSIFFRPELVYTATRSDYNNDAFKMKKIDAPLLVGLKVIGPLNVFAGPSLQYILDSEFDGIDIKDIENDFTVGLNFGVGISIKNIGIDLRYERGLSKNEARFLSNNNIDLNSRLDTRPDQLILGLSVAL